MSDRIRRHMPGTPIDGVNLNRLRKHVLRGTGLGPGMAGVVTGQHQVISAPDIGKTGGRQLILNAEIIDIANVGDGYVLAQIYYPTSGTYGAVLNVAVSQDIAYEAGDLILILRIETGLVVSGAAVLFRTLDGGGAFEIEEVGAFPAILDTPQLIYHTGDDTLWWAGPGLTHWQPLGWTDLTGAPE